MIPQHKLRSNQKLKLTFLLFNPNCSEWITELKLEFIGEQYFQWQFNNNNNLALISTIRKFSSGLF